MSVHDPNHNNISPASHSSSANLPVVPVSAGQLATSSPPGMMWNEEPPRDDGLNPVRLLHALRRRWLSATLLGLLTACTLVSLLYICFPRNFEAEALVRVRREKQSVLMTASSNQRNNMHDYDTFKKTQAALMKSTFVINAALRKSGISQLPMIKVEEDPTEWLAENIGVANPQDSEILSITLKGEDQDEIEKIVNAVVDSYWQEIVQSEREADLDRLEILKRTSRKHSQELKEKQELIGNLAREVGSASVSEEARLAHKVEFDGLMRRQSRRDQVRDELRKVETNVMVMARRADASFIPSDFEIEDYMDGDPFYADAKARLTFAQTDQRSAYASGFPPSPQLQREVQLAYAEVQRIKNDIKPRIVERIRRNLGHDDSRTTELMGILQTERGILIEQFKLLQQEYEAQLDTLRKSIGHSAELEMRKTELEGMTKMMETVHTEMESLDLNLKTKPRIQIIQPAMVPVVSDWFSRFSLFGCVFVLALGGTAFCVALWDYQSKRVNVPDDINSETTIRVVGSLPTLDRRGVLPFGGLRGSSLESVLIESIDSIRTTLLCSNGDDPVNVVMVTSASAQEGKTTLAGQLAISLARSGRRTLLIDGDLHNPQQHYVFGLPFGRGFCELLRNEATVDEVVQHVSVEGLSLINAGYCDQASLRALASERALNVLNQLRSEFDFIVLDAGPVLVGADPLLLGQHADTVLLSVRRDISQIPKINQACDRLRSVGVDIKGAVVSGAGVEVRRTKLELAYDDSEQTDEAIEA